MRDIRNSLTRRMNNKLADFAVRYCNRLILEKMIFSGNA